MDQDRELELLREIETLVVEREEWNGKHQECVMALDRLRAAFKDHYWDSLEPSKELILAHVASIFDLVIAGVDGRQK